MVKRATRNSSPLFQRVLHQAEVQLLNEAEKAENYAHNGLRGNHRATALGQFLTNHLPNTFKVAKGQARDYKDNVTGELDLLIYDQLMAAPIQSDAETLIVPAEALYAVIEVKSILTKDEIETCFTRAEKVRSLKPFKKPIIAAPTNGQAEDDRQRCPYFLFAYKSNLGADNWASKEYQRLVNSAEEKKGSSRLPGHGRRAG